MYQLWYIDDEFKDRVTLTLSPHQLTYPEKAFDTAFIGLAVTGDGETTTMKYTNEAHEILENIVCPWYEDIEYGSEITIKNVK